MKKLNNEVWDRFIVFEGLDGAGTTTQIGKLNEKLIESGYSTWLTWEPTDNPVGKLIREVLTKKISVTPDTLAQLYAADRNQHLYGPGGIKDHRELGDIVLCDRYIFSSLAYQTLGSDSDLIFSLNSRYPLPRTVIFIDVDPEICQERLSSRNEQELFDKIGMQKKIREMYRHAFSLIGNGECQVITIDGNGSINEIFGNISGKVMNGSIFEM